MCPIAGVCQSLEDCTRDASADIARSMRTFVARGLFLVITLAGGLSAASDESVFNRFEERRARRKEMEKAVQTTSQEGADRYAAIVTALRAAGYDLVPVESPFTWRLASPVSATPIPTIRIEFYPLTTTPEAMKERFNGASVETPQNFLPALLLSNRRDAERRHCQPVRSSPARKNPFGETSGRTA
jgi:hypothetical protein